jgi:hypothetical protein
MKIPVLSLAVLCITLLGCPKAAPGMGVGANDNETLDTWAAQLEELKTRPTEKCADWCGTKPRVCELAKSICELAGRHAGSDEFQKRCVAGNEDCARYNDGCTNCSKK